jgi:hypothetical protein
LAESPVQDSADVVDVEALAALEVRWSATSEPCVPLRKAGYRRAGPWSGWGASCVFGPQLQVIGEDGE